MTYLTAGSAATATAIFSGEKTNSGVIGLNQNVERGNCESEGNNQLTSILHKASLAGLYVNVFSLII